MRNFATPVFWLCFAALGLVALVSPEHPAFAATTTASPASTLTGTPSLSNSDNGTAAATAITATLTPTATRQTATPTQTITATETMTATPELTATATLTLPTATPTNTQTPTATRYALPLDSSVLSIDALRARKYGGSTIKITRVVSDNQAYRVALFEYLSDGLKITGMMYIPHGSIPPFPVVVMDHGYFKPSEYHTGDGTTRAADVFARNGYMTLAPDYRCYAGSQCGPDPFYIGYAIDVLNLIADIPSLPDADPSRVGIWGHSMGGGITIRVITVNNSLKVAALYGALSSDDEVHYCWLYGCTTPLVTPIPRDSHQLQELDPNFFRGVGPATPDASLSYKARLHQIFMKSSPSHFLHYIDTPVIINHGENDDIVPIQWSVDLANQLNLLGKTAVLYTYPGQGHIFEGWGWQLFMSRTLSFFDKYLNPRATPITVDKRVLQQERVASQLSY